MVKLDLQEYHIVKQLIRNPRISDNEIARRTRIPLGTVNRKRKILEERGLLSYHAYLHTFRGDLNHFEARCMVSIKLRHGITRKKAEQALESNPNTFSFNAKHILESHIGEEDGHIVILLIIESLKDDDIVEILNAETIPSINHSLGDNTVISTNVTKISSTMRILKNYLPYMNMESGIIKDDWDDSNIYVI